MKRIFAQKQPDSGVHKRGLNVTATAETGGLIHGIGARASVSYQQGRGLSMPRVNASLSPSPKGSIELSMPISHVNQKNTELRIPVEKSEGKKTQAEIGVHHQSKF